METSDKKPGNGDNGKSGRNPMKMFLYYYLIIMVITFVINALGFSALFKPKVELVTYTEFMEQIDAGKVTTVSKENENTLVFIAKDDCGEPRIYKTGIWVWPDEELNAALQKQGVIQAAEIPTEPNPIVNFFLTWIMPILMFTLIGMVMSKIMSKRMGGGWEVPMP